MNLVAKNVSVITRELYAEAVSATAKKWHRNIYFGIAFVLLVAAAFGFMSPNPLTGLIFVAGAAFVVFRALTSDRNEAKRNYEAAKSALGGEELVKTVCFYEDKLTVESGSEVFESTYEGIKRDMVTKNLYIVFLRDNTAVFVRSDSFVEGSLEDVRKLCVSKYF